LGLEGTWKNLQTTEKKIVFMIEKETEWKTNFIEKGQIIQEDKRRQ
jgi:hypothetical protein